MHSVGLHLLPKVQYVLCVSHCQRLFQLLSPQSLEDWPPTVVATCTLHVEWLNHITGTFHGHSCLICSWSLYVFMLFSMIPTYGHFLTVSPSGFLQLLSCWSLRPNKCLQNGSPNTGQLAISEAGCCSKREAVPHVIAFFFLSLSHYRGGSSRCLLVVPLSVSLRHTTTGS